MPLTQSKKKQLVQDAKVVQVQFVQTPTTGDPQYDLVLRATASVVAILRQLSPDEQRHTVEAASRILNADASWFSNDED